MLIASMIVKVIPEHAEEVAQQLERTPNITSYGVHKENNIIIVTEAHDVEQLENIARYILETYPDVLGVFPTFVGSEEEDVEQPVEQK